MEAAQSPNVLARLRDCALRAGSAILDGFARMGDDYYVRVEPADPVDASMQRFTEQIKRT
ncbi:MAG TPA: hypothetical protein VF466_02050 [Candidatus Saccharimonadales bacterium]